MPRVSDELRAQLQSDVPLLSIVQAAGVVLTADGEQMKGTCPFHRDNSMSLQVDPQTQRWRCPGCQTEGDIVEWVMRAEGVSLRHALTLLQQGYQPRSTAHRPVRVSSVRKLPLPFNTDVPDAELLLRVVNYYHETLLQSPEALAYLQQRGIGTEEAIHTFKLGFANRTLAYRLPQSNRLEGADLRGRLQQLGILRSSGHEHFNGSVVIPIFDERGAIVQIYGRKLLDNLRAGTPKHLYLPAPHRGVFNAASLRACREVILCGALIDALTFWCAGFHNVTASYGMDGFTDEHRSFFKQSGVQRLFIAYARNEDGDRAAESLAQQLMDDGVECLRVLFPHGFDANSYALKVQPAEKSLAVALRGAHWIGKGAVRAPVLRTSNAQRAPSPASEGAPPPTDVAVTVPSASLNAEPASAASPEAPSIDAHHVEKDPVASQQEADDAPLGTSPSAIRSIDVPIEVREHEILILLGDRRWRVRGLSDEPTPGQLKVNLLVSRGEAFHVDTLDLYAARLRTAYLRQAAAELAFSEATLKRDLGAVLLKLEALQAERAAQPPAVPALTMTAEEKAAAMALLRDPQLIERIVADLTMCGVIGEDTNKLVAYLACLSRKQDKPLAILIQSTSAAGKSTLMDAVLSLMPPEERVHYSAMTGQSLFYMGEIGLKHKILGIAEEQGVQEAAYALKLLQSQGELTIASTGKDPVSGRLVTQEYKVQGPVMLFLTTTAIEVDEELLNRCLVLSVNESREQTRAIHALQRKHRTLAALLERKQRDTVVSVHQNAQRLLRALPVVNPYAEQLSFVDVAARTRRDHEKYLSLIESIALLGQYQRELRAVEHAGERIEYVEVTTADIELANDLARRVLGQSLDELPPQTRRLLQLIDEMVTKQCTAQQLSRSQYRFSRRDVREYAGFGHTQLKVHLQRLEEMEYVAIHRGRAGSFQYELLYERHDDREYFLPGLIDPHKAPRPQVVGREGDRSGSERSEVGVVSGVGPTSENPGKQATCTSRSGSADAATRQSNPKSHRTHASSPTAADTASERARAF